MAARLTLFPSRGPHRAELLGASTDQFQAFGGENAITSASVGGKTDTIFHHFWRAGALQAQAHAALS
jgi:hypothetical protein